MKVDFLVVGSGLTGATIARALADRGREVLVLERRSHTGGNVHDHVHASGVRIQTYGPHYFRTDSEQLWEYVNRFAKFVPFRARVAALVDGRLVSWPLGASTVRRMAGEGWTPAFVGTPRNFEEACLAMMPRSVYEKCVKGYSEKHWGCPARDLSASLAGRFDVRADDDPSFTRHRFQGLPAGGYAAWIEKMLEGIPTELGYNFLEDRARFTPRRLLIFTGAIDEFFGFRLGRLKYRGQVREHRYLPDTDVVQVCPQVNNPQWEGGPHLRTLEWRQMMSAEDSSKIRGTVLTTETAFSPENPDEYEYPFPDAVSQELYRRYADLAAALPGMLACGRLGEYRYLDMDTAIERAQSIASRILDANG